MRAALLALIRFYRRRISPLFPPCCRFYPSCSMYALQAIEKYGACKGGWLALKRVLRCNPFTRGATTPSPKPKGRFPRTAFKRGNWTNSANDGSL